MHDIKSTLDFLLTREKYKSLLSKVNVNFSKETNNWDIVADLVSFSFAEPNFEHELKPRQDFLYMDIINWFRNESAYDIFADWLEQIKDHFEENMKYITSTDNYTASFKADDSYAEIIYLATMKQSHLIFQSEKTTTVKITYNLETKELIYTIYSDDVYERVAYKSYILNIIEQISYDNLTRVTYPFEKDIHFINYLKAKYGFISKRTTKGMINLFANNILGGLNLEDCELKIENKTNTTLNEIDKSTTIEILNYYLTRYIDGSSQYDAMGNMNNNLVDFKKSGGTDRTFSYELGDGYVHDVICIYVSKNNETKTINKLKFTFRKRGKNNISSSLTFEQLDNKFRVTLYDKDVQEEESSDVNLLYKLVGRPLEIKEQEDIDIQTDNAIKEILQIITDSKGRGQLPNGIKIFADVKATNRGNPQTNIKPEKDINFNLNNLINISLDQLIYELPQAYKLKNMSSEVAKGLIHHYDIQKRSNQTDTDAHTFYFGAFFEETYNYTFLMIEENFAIIALYYDKTKNTLIYTVDAPAMSMSVKIKQHLLESEKSKDKILQHKDINYYDPNEYDTIELEELNSPAPYTDNLLNFIYEEFKPLYTVVCLDKAITDTNGSDYPCYYTYDCYDIDNRQIPDVINTAFNRLSQCHQLSYLEKAITNAVSSFKSKGSANESENMYSNEIEIMILNRDIVDMDRKQTSSIHINISVKVDRETKLGFTIFKLDDTLVIEFKVKSNHQMYIYETLKPILLSYNPIQQLNKDLTSAKTDSTKPLKSILAEYIPTDCIKLTYLYNKATIILTQKNTNIRMPFKFDGLQLRHFFVEILQWYYIDYDNNKDFHEMSLITDTINRLLNKEDKLIGFSNDRVSYLFNPSSEGSTIVIEASNNKIYEKLLKAFNIIKTLPSKKITQTLLSEDTSTDKEDKTPLTPTQMWKSKH